jgi:heat shock protein HslJ
MRHSIFAAFALVAACAAPAPPSGPDAIHLSGTHWRLETSGERPPTIDFEDHRAAGFAGCNRWFAAVTQNGEELRFGDVGATRMACPEPQMTTERDFLAALAATRYGHYDRDALVLLDAEQQQVARFVRAN